MAVTAACLLVARGDYDRCGGLNERFRRHYEDDVRKGIQIEVTPGR